jgi:hypothetical protein
MQLTWFAVLVLLLVREQLCNKAQEQKQAAQTA